MGNIITVDSTADLANKARGQADYIFVKNTGVFGWVYDATANGTTVFQASTQPLAGGGYWELLAGSGSGTSAISDLTDVVLTTPASGDTLQYNGTDFVNVNNGFTELTGTSWDGSNKYRLSLAADLAVVLISTKVAGLLVIEDNATHTLTINGVNIPINNTTATVIGFTKANGIYYIIDKDGLTVQVPTIEADTTAPTVTFEAVDPNTLRATFSESMGTVTIAGFSFKQNGTPITPDSVSGATTTWDFVVSETMVNTDTLLWSYDSSTGATSDVAENELATATDQAVTNSISESEYIIWEQLTNMADTGSGTLDNTNTSAGGGTASKKLAKVTGNYVQHVVPAITSENEYFVFFLSQYNDGINTWSGTDVIAGVYQATTVNIRIGTSGGGSTTDTLISPSAGEIWRFEISGDDILINRSTNSGASFSTVSTKTGVLTGITDIFVRGILVTGVSDQRVIQNAKGKGLVTI